MSLIIIDMSLGSSTIIAKFAASINVNRSLRMA